MASSHNDFDGLCIVHAHYENIEHLVDVPNISPIRSNANIAIIHDDIISNSSSIFDDSGKIIKNTNIQFDFNNLLFDKTVIFKGIGYVKNIRDKQYVITCNSVIVKRCLKYVGYCVVAGNTVNFDMTVVHRIPEIDLVIMEILTKPEVDYKIPELITSNKLLPMFNKKANNIVLSGSKNPDIKFEKIDINNNINICFEILKSQLIPDIPLINIPIQNTEIVQKIFREHGINYDKDILNMPNDTKRMQIIKLISDNIQGLSGSIIQSNGHNIGMTCIFTDTNKGIGLKAIPFVLIDMIINNAIFYNKPTLMGIHTDNTGCDIEYMKQDMTALLINKRSSPYINGKKMFTFEKDDIITDIDGKKIIEHNLIHSDILGFPVPLNTYLMVQCNHDLTKTVAIRIIRGTQKPRVYNLSAIPYDDMHCCSIVAKGGILCNNIIFMELSEELIMFYAKLGIHMTYNNIHEVAKTKNEKKIILFNYNTQFTFPKTPQDNVYYLSRQHYMYLPLNYSSDGKHKCNFYSVKQIGQKKINSIDDISDIYNSGEDKKISIKLQHE
jgi:hypothetical protein